MGKPKINQLRQLNRYSWSIIIAFINATFVMQYHTANISFEGFFQTLPLILIMIYWCEKSAPLVMQFDCNLKKIELFNRDLFILSFSFLLACLISIIFSYHNSDVKGWWTLIIYFITLYGLLFSVIFSIIALSIKNHKIYIMIFSLIIIVLISLGGFFPHYMPLPLLGNVDTFFVITGLMLIIHCNITICYSNAISCKSRSE